MRAALCLLASSLVVLGHAQEWTGASLGKPQYVAPEVESVVWSEDGRCLAYTSRKGDSVVVGVFDLESGKTGEVVKIPAGDVVSSLDWLRSGKKAVLVVKGTTGGPNVRVLVLDAQENVAKQVWNRAFKAGEDPNVAVEVSPLLAHALITVATGAGSETWVLTAGANTVVFSRDIAQAQGQGHQFADWSSSGTAVFSNAASSGVAHVMNLKISGGNLKADQFEITLGDVQAAPAKEGHRSGSSSRVNFLSNIPILNRFFLRMRPEIPAGATVLECVPSNGALRPVRFSGYYEPRAPSPDRPDVRSKLTPLTLGKAVAGSNALWLTPVDPNGAVQEEGTPVQDPPTGVLVSAQADAWWPSPSLNAIAFSWNGVVFVRSVTMAGM